MHTNSQTFQPLLSLETLAKAPFDFDNSEGIYSDIVGEASGLKADNLSPVRDLGRISVTSFRAITVVVRFLVGIHLCHEGLRTMPWRASMDRLDYGYERCSI